METVASWVTHRVHPLVEILERRGVVEELVEETEDGLWVGLRAHATIVGANCRVGHLEIWLENGRYKDAKGIIN